VLRVIRDSPIATERFSLVTLDESFAGEAYLRWLTDEETTAFLETRFADNTPEGLGKYVRAMMASSDSYLFAIVERSSNQHIGNIKLGPINFNHKTASIGLFIGESSWWGKGVAKEVIAAITSWAFDEIALAKVSAGSYSSNVGSIRAFEACGFYREGHLANQVLLSNGERDDVILLGKLNPHVNSATGQSGIRHD
jgi:ribosomal-protein-alanine N-acetyltransferase